MRPATATAFFDGASKWVAVFTAVTQFACASAETPGDRFRKSMAERRAYCDGRELSPGETTCKILTLVRPDPLATPEGRLAHSIKLPVTVAPKAYRAGMTSEEYFRLLCEESGEFIFTKVNDVEGIMELRPRAMASDDMLRHLYALEDPYGYRDWQARNPEFFYVSPKAYQFFERALTSGQPKGQVLRYSGYDGRTMATMKRETEDAPRSRYGFTWRGISRPNDREMGIAGGELIVVDIDTLQVLGVKRGFARTGEAHPVPLGIWWRLPSVCPGDSNETYVPGRFVTKVLIPAQR